MKKNKMKLNEKYNFDNAIAQPVVAGQRNKSYEVIIRPTMTYQVVACSEFDAIMQIKVFAESKVIAATDIRSNNISSDTEIVSCERTDGASNP